MAGEPSERGAEAGDPAAGEERLELPADPGRLLGVDEGESPEPVVTGDGVSGDHAAAVVADHGDVVEVEQIDRATHGVDVVGDRQWRVGGVPARPGAGQVEEVAGDVFGEVREQVAERGPADRPPVHEEHVGALSDDPVGDLTGPDVQEACRFLSEQVAGGGSRESRHAPAS